MNRVVEGTNLKDVWIKMMTLVYKDSIEVFDGRKKIKEFLNLISSILNPLEDSHVPNLPDEVKEELSKRGWDNLPRALIEPDVAEWFLPGKRLKWKIGNGIIDQIEEFVIKALKQNPYTRRAVVVTLNPVSDSKKEVHLKPDYPFPAILNIDFKFYKERLHLIAYLRSCEVYLWWPVNMVQFAHLLKYVAEKCNFELGTLTAMISCAHIREENFDKVLQLIG